MKYTIIVVNYNKEKYLKKCLDSIMNQTYKKFNVIIVDDGSTDNSRNIIETYRKYKNVYIYFKDNTGVADSRNFAIEKVKTKYFTFVDSDDYIDKKLLETCDNYDNYEILAFNNYLCSHNNKVKKDFPKGEITDKSKELIIKTFIDHNCLFLVPWGYIYKTDFFRKNKLKYKKGYVHEDVYLTTMALLKSKKTISIDFYGYYYALTSNSIMRNKDYQRMKLRCDSILFYYDTLKEYFDKNIKDEELKKQIIGYYLQLLLYTGRDLKRKWRKPYVEELEKRNICNYMLENTKIGRIKKKMCKISFMLYFDIYPLFIPCYSFIRRIYYLVIKHEKI